MIILLLMGMLAAEANAMKADQVIVVKSERTLTLLSHGKVLRTYKVALGGTPIGAKEQQGDHKTPEGLYILDRRNAKSQFCKSIHVSYPNMEDSQKAAQRGVAPGSDIMIHGLPNGFGWFGRHSSRTGLDRWLYRGNECGNGRNLGTCARRDSHRNSPMSRGMPFCHPRLEI
jgi:murein L,D-transpeptidase YafK